LNDLENKLLGIFQIVTIPVSARVLDGLVIIELSGTRKQISSIPESIFFALEPKEIIEILDRDLTKKNGYPTSILRTDFSGHNKNPFSSQN
tara:strand:+ start:234 stop:506 length:273 start_codon:yes stop_codon:yes gene_type:complete